MQGPLRGALPPDLERGIKLHRAIDAYTDEHPLIQQLRPGLPPAQDALEGAFLNFYPQLQSFCKRWIEVL